MIHRFCISHEKPLLPESWYDVCISLGDYQPDSVSHVRQLDQFWHEARPIAYGTAGTNVLPIAIERFASAATLIEICSHRKRVLASSEGIESELVSGCRELRFGDFEEKAELSVQMPPADLEFLIPQPLYFENSIVEKQIELRHYDRRDLRDYTSIAIEMGALESDSLNEFLAARHFIPGGSQIGIYPKSWLMSKLSKRELIDRQFLSRYRHRIEKYEAVQIRAVSFLAECLGSFLLIRHLAEKYSNNIPAGIFGYVTVILDSDIWHAQGIEKVNRARK
ncbi:hypothetical protein H7J93_02580 [Mycobacterium barrassiae]|uniref:hypothetical protein n=1 Tax=Mycobacterium barrassiae TaxID=319709 RepID=UPI0022658E19|nr:hypothetical protein [Mycobacterium barrassiae]MCV7298521.1 hypothetical protein [Mycobacterium barrassiae]